MYFLLTFHIDELHDTFLLRYLFIPLVTYQTSINNSNSTFFFLRHAYHANPGADNILIRILLVTNVFQYICQQQCITFHVQIMMLSLVCIPKFSQTLFVCLQSASVMSSSVWFLYTFYFSGSDVPLNLSHLLIWIKIFLQYQIKFAYISITEFICACKSFGKIFVILFLIIFVAVCTFFIIDCHVFKTRLTIFALFYVESLSKVISQT